MSYLVLARKCRPTRFTEVVGQSHVTQTLANAIKMDRVAHGFLFSGVRGVGKTSLARILAKSLNCKDGPTDNPCGECESCKTITDGTAVDVIEIDGASNNSVEDIRELRETVPYRPIIGRFKIYVIDEVHMLSVSAFNALLKTLEEPPSHVKFIFATTEPHKIPNTILSRIQRYDFRRISTGAIIGRIKEILEEEGIVAEDSALAIVGREADGSMRDALSILDQVLAAGEKEITADYVASLLGVVGRQTYFELSGAIVEQNPSRCLEIVQEVDKQGFDIPTFTRGLLEHLRNLVVAAVCGDEIGFLELPQEEFDELKKQSNQASKDTIHRMFKHVSQAYEEIARSSFPKILLEATVARVADLGELVPAADIMQRLEALSKGQPAAVSAPMPAVRPSVPPQGAALVADVKKKDNFVNPALSTPQPSPNAPQPGKSVSNVQASSHAGRKPVTQPASVPSPPGTQPPQQPAMRMSQAQQSTTSKPSSQSSEPSRDAPVAKRPKGPERPIGKAEWEKVLGQLAAKMPAKSSILERANLGENSTTSKIVLQFDRSDAFTAGQAKEQGLAKQIETFLSETLNSEVSLSVEICDLGERSTLAQKRLKSQEQIRKQEEVARNHPVIRGFESALGGKISKVRLNK